MQDCCNILTDWDKLEGEGKGTVKTKLMTLVAAALAAAASIYPAHVLGQAATPAGAVPPVIATPFYQGVPNNATIPRIVPEQCIPRPLSTDVSAALTSIQITFDQPMDVALFYWPLPTNDALFPFVTNNPYWINGNKTVVLPVKLSAGRIYSIPINSPNLVFRGSTGLYVNPGLFRFTTGAIGRGGGNVPGANAGPRLSHGSSGGGVTSPGTIPTPGFLGSGAPATGVPAGSGHATTGPNNGGGGSFSPSLGPNGNLRRATPTHTPVGARTL